MDVTEFCLFCPTEFPAGAGSPEHIFLSSIGGRVATRHAICAQCNNAFSNIETNEADQALRGMLLHACNALNIVSGRGDAPPIIERAYEESPGVFYDLAPGLIPVPRRAVIPWTEDLRGKSEHGFVASDRADARRVLEILRLRKDELRSLGVEVTVGAPTVVSRHLPGFNVPLKFNVQAAARCVAKTAAVAANVLHGNAVARNHVDADLRIAARNANSDMQPFVAFGFAKPWVRLENVRPHPQTPQAISSGFEHSVSLVDVRARWVAFVEFFGAYRFTVDMGAQSGLPSCALIVNPRAATR